nr:MAG TPA: hypothetical protein [Caudoviricetes sp.]
MAAGRISTDSQGRAGGKNVAGKIKNFTLQGNLMSLTASVDAHGVTRYELDIDDRALYTTTFDGLVDILSEIRRDLSEVFELRYVYTHDDDGKVVQDENGLWLVEGEAVYNPHIEDFEKTWGEDADE